MDNRNLSSLQRVFLWNQLSFSLKHFELFGFDNVLDNALAIQTGDQKNAQNILRLKIRSCLRGKYYLIFKKVFFKINFKKKKKKKKKKDEYDNKKAENENEEKKEKEKTETEINMNDRIEEKNRSKRRIKPFHIKLISSN